MLRSLSIGEGPPYSDPTDFVSIKLCELRHDLAPPGSSPAEKLLAERATLCWLHLEVLEYEAARLFNRNHLDTPKAEIIDRRLALRAGPILAFFFFFFLLTKLRQLGPHARPGGAVQQSLEDRHGAL